MGIHHHIRLLSLVTVAWILFWIGGLPDYYQQYPTAFMIIFDLVILLPIWFLIYGSLTKAEPGKALIESLWWSFYISFPLFIYDVLYVGIYLGQGISFLKTHWYVTVYYILPWLLFPPTGWVIDQRRRPNVAQSNSK